MKKKICSKDISLKCEDLHTLKKIIVRQTPLKAKQMMKK